jgi:hypothetical protein
MEAFLEAHLTMRFYLGTLDTHLRQGYMAHYLFVASLMESLDPRLKSWP